MNVIIYSKRGNRRYSYELSIIDDHMFVMLYKETEKHQPNNYAIIMNNASINKTKM